MDIEALKERSEVNAESSLALFVLVHPYAPISHSHLLLIDSPPHPSPPHGYKEDLFAI